MTDAEIRAHLKAAPDTPVIRLTEPGRAVFFHACAGWGRIWMLSLDTPLVWTPDGRPPACRCYYGRCRCGAIVLSEPTLSEERPCSTNASSPRRSTPPGRSTL
jgi:hypothetical protein